MRILLQGFGDLTSGLGCGHYIYMKYLLIVGMWLFLAAPVIAQEASTEPTSEPTVAEEVVTADSVPDPDSFGDFFQRLNERMQLLTTRDQERKAVLEEKFANRRAAQLEKCEKFEKLERKDKCLQKVTERSEKLLERLQKRADKVTEKRQQLLQKLERARNRKTEKLEEVKERREGRREDRQERREERKDERKDRREERKEDRVEGARTSRPDLLELVEDALDNIFGR